MTIDTYLFQPNSTGAVNGFQQSVAVVVGIDGYGYGIPPLHTAVADASRLADLLETQHGYTVHRLTEDVHHVRLRSFFNETLPTLLTAEDRLLLYFAGHGVALDGEDGPAGYLIPQDARPEDPTSFLSMLDVHAALDTLPCRHMLAIFDCCFAGAFRWASMRSLRPMPETIHKERYDRFIQHPAWQVITSASYDEEALDILRGDLLGRREEGAGNHSPFAAALFAALEGEGDLIPKGEGDGVITAAELYLYLRNSVEQRAEQFHHRQTPGIWPLHKHDKGEYIFLVPGYGELNLPPAPPLNLDNNPYKGLNAYDSSRKDARLFFGREDLESELAARVAEQPFTVVLGASGTGKSSLVKAGVLPRLAGWHQEDAADDDAQLDWPIHHEDWVLLQPLRPTANPLRALEHALQQPLSLPPGGDLADALDAWFAAHVEQKLLLVIDQFEELITLCRSDDERNGFQRLLARLIANHPDHLRVVLTLRSDFEPQFAASPLAGLWTPEVRFVAPPMDQDDLRRAIEGPASERVLYFEPPELVDRLINEVIQTPGALPLLSFTLSELYVRYVESESDNRALTEAHYQALGGVVGSLRTSAEREFNALDPTHQATMQRAMLRMVAVEGGEIARRRVPRSELIYASEEENARVAEVLSRLVAARLVVTGRDDNGHEFVEPAHDALVRAWDRLLVWKREADEYLPLQRRVAQAARDWSISGELHSLLWNGNAYLPQLKEEMAGPVINSSWLAARWHSLQDLLWPRINAGSDGTWLNHLESTFVQRSIARQGSLNRRITTITMGVILGLSVATGWALTQQNLANKRSDELAAEVVVRTTAEADAVVAQETAVFEADARATEVVVRSTAEAIAVAREAEAQREAAIARSRELAARAESVSADRPVEGLLLAIESVTATWNIPNNPIPIYVAGAEQALRDATASMGGYPLASSDTESSAIAIAPNSATVARAEGASVLLHALDAPFAAPTPLMPAADAIETILFTPDSKSILAGSSEHALYLWDVDAPTASPIALYDFPNTTQHNPLEILFAGGGEHVIFASSAYVEMELGATMTPTTSVLMWPLRKMASTPIVLVQETVILRNFTVSSDGRYLAAFGPDAEIWRWDLHDLEADPVRFATDADPNRTSIHAGGGNYIVFPAASEDPTIAPVLWSMSSVSPTIAQLPSTVSAESQVVLSPGGTVLALADSSHEIRVWSLAALDAQPLHLTGLGADIQQIHFSPDGTYLATTNSDLTVSLWDLQNPVHAPLTFRGHNDPIQQVEFANDRRFIVTLTGEGETRLWDIHKARQEPVVVLGREAGTDRLAFSADGHFVFGSTGDEILLWQASEPDTSPLVLHGVHSTPYLAVATDDQRMLAAAGVDIGLQVWDLEEPESAPLLLRGHSGSIIVLAFSPDNRYLVSAGRDQTVRLWDLTQPQGPPISLVGHEGTINQLAISRDSRWLAASGFSNTVRIWLLDDPIASSFTLRSHSDTVTFIHFTPNGNYLISGSDDYTLHLWRTSDWNTDPTVLFGHTNQITSVDVSPDDRYVVSSSRDNTVRLWNLKQTIPSSVVLRNHPFVSYVGLSDKGLRAVRFSPDGQHLVTGDDEGRIFVWTLSEPESEPVVFADYGSAVRDVRFAPNAHYLATVTHDSQVQFWTFPIQVLVDQACMLAGRNLAWEEWERNFRRLDYRVTCSRWPVPRSVAVAYADRGRSYARQGDPEQALVWLQRARDLDDTVVKDPEQEIQRIVELSFRDSQEEYTTDASARNNALEQIDKMLLGMGTVFSPPETMLSEEVQISAQEFGEIVASIGTFVTLGQETQAIDHLQQALTYAHPDLSVSAEIWHQLCRLGSVFGYAAEVLPYCTLAVEQADDQSQAFYTGSRGVARALIGDTAGAVADLEQFVEWTKTSRRFPYPRYGRLREEWIRRLQDGEGAGSIFNSDVIEQLKQELL